MTELMVNPLFLFLAVWGSATALYLSGVYTRTFAMPLPLTLGIVLLNVWTFFLGYQTWTLFANFRLRPAGIPLPSLRPLTPDRITRGLQFTLLMGIIVLLLVLHRVMVIAAQSDIGFLDLLTQPEMLRARLVSFIGGNVYQTSGMVMLISVAGSLFSIGFVLLGVFLYISNTAVKYFYLCAFLGLSLAIGLLNLSRYETVVNILFIVFAYCLSCSVARRRAPGRVLFDLLLPLAAAAVLFIGIEMLLRKGTVFGLTSRLHGFLYSLYWYAASPLAAFNEWLSGFNGDYELGQNTFFPLYKWLCKFHLAPEPDISVYGEFVFIPYVANVYTYLRNFYEDFGILGVAVAPYLLGWLTAAVRGPARTGLHYLNLYVILLAFLLFSFYNYFMVSNQIYLQILFGFLFFRYDLTNAHESWPRAHAAAESALLHSR